jgi:hypothetical protein
VPQAGDRVRIQRDEMRYPPKGTWPKFCGRTGTVVEINMDRQRPHLTEYGVSFGKVTPAGPGARRVFDWNAGDVVWFKFYEMFPLASQRHAERGYGTPEGKGAVDGSNLHRMEAA